MPEEETYICPRCHRTSWNPNDVREGYCGACHDWTEAPPEEVLKITSPPPAVGSFWRYLWKEHYWAYYNVSVSLLCWVTSIAYSLPWGFSLFFGVAFGVSAQMAYMTYTLWKRRVAAERAGAEWVDRIVSLGYPRHIAQAADNLIQEDKTHVAARLMIEHLKQTDPQARQWFDEFDELPHEEQVRLRSEAMAKADADLGRDRP